MRRLCVLIFLATQGAARYAGRESSRRTEKRREQLVAGLGDYERSMITEMHTQGLNPDHINIQLGLGRSGGYVREVVEALRIDKPSRGGRRTGPKKARGKPAPRPAPSDLPAAHRARARERKRRRREL